MAFGTFRRAFVPSVRMVATPVFTPHMVLARSLSSQVQTFLERDEVLERVVRVVKNFEKVDESKVTEEAHLANDLGLDSLDTVEVCMALEEEFCVQIPDAEAEKIFTIQDAIDFVATHPQAK